MFRRSAALVLAAALSLSLAGCFGLERVGDAVDAATDLADRATEAADALSSVEWGKLSRAVVRDAASDEKIAEVTDQSAIGSAFTGLSGECGLAATPDAAEEYVIEVWQPTTATVANGGDTEEVQVLEVTTYEGSDVVTLEVTPVGLTLTLDAPAGAADDLRALAS